MKKVIKQAKWWATHPVDLFRRVAAVVYTKLHPDEPWISHHAIRYLETTLASDMTGLEWGSGRSTAWFAKRLMTLTSVEHNDSWYSLVQVKLKKSQAWNVNYQHIPLEHAERAPTFKNYYPVPRYVAVAEDFADNSLDFVVVDGHYRQACVGAVLPKLKPGGLLLIDNSNWMPLDEWGVPQDWPLAHHSRGFFGATTVWKKPS